MIAKALGDNASMLAASLYGTREARARHAEFCAQAATASAGIRVLNQRWPHLVGASDTPIFVLGGGWRTGSTLVQRMLMADDLVIWGEPYSHCALVETLASQLQAFNAHWPWAEFFLSAAAADSLSETWVANLYPDPQRFLNAHIAYFDALYAQSALALGKPNWGVKEVLLTSEHAAYLRWLYPRAWFIALYRNPYDAWASYRHWRSWYRRWPDQPVHTPSAFGRLWRELTSDLIENHRHFGGFTVRYEDLKDRRTHDRLQEYLQRPVTPLRDLPRVGGAGARSAGRYVPKLEKRLLARQVEPLAADLGYRCWV